MWISSATRWWPRCWACSEALAQTGAGSALEPAATFKIPDAIVKVYFNRTPRQLLGAGLSRYLGVIGTYSGIGGLDRRPDILLRIEHATKSPSRKG